MTQAQQIETQITPTTKPVFIMNRTDGLGERLCAMINAIRLADTLNRDFQYHWTSDIWNPVYHELDTEKDRPILGQSVAPQEEIFSSKFIESYAIEKHVPQQYRACPGRPITREKFVSAETDENFFGWAPNQNFLENECENAFMSMVKLSSKAAFKKIDFAPKVKSLISTAENTLLPAFDAVHLRSGDMVFGEVRKWGQWSNKVLNPSVAKDLIMSIKAKGRQVILFGQDVEGLQALSEELGCLFVGTLIPASAKTPTQRALFEIVLMSRAKDIYAGYSGFSRVACMIGNKRAKVPSQVYTTEQYIDITMDDLKKNSVQYHPLMAAYSYWQAYDLGEEFFNLPEQYEIISSAVQNDPQNQLYSVLRAALLYRMGRDDEAESWVAEKLSAVNESAFIDQLVFKYYSTDYTHRNQFNDFHGAARRPKNKYAKICAAAIAKRLKK